jgi:hypothetical protein
MNELHSDQTPLHLLPLESTFSPSNESQLLEPNFRGKFGGIGYIIGIVILVILLGQMSTNEKPPLTIREIRAIEGVPNPFHFRGPLATFPQERNFQESSTASGWERFFRT